MMSLRLVLTLSSPLVSFSQWISGTWTTGYWDCCKPSCSWPSKGSVNHPVPSCDKATGLFVTNPDEASVCDGGTAGSCADNQPFMVNDGLSMGFAAAAVGGVSGLNGDENCGQCYELQFTGESHFSGQWHWGGSHPDLVGKTHVVQVTNIGYDVSGVHSFDLQIPGAGMGQFQNGCPNQYPTYSNDAFDCGNHWGGCSSISGCAALPQELQNGCEWRYNWYKWLMNDGKTNNPYVMFRRVKCPSQITDVTGTVPLDDDRYPAINIDDYASSSRRRSTTAASTNPTATTENPSESTTSVAATQNAPQCSSTGADCRATRCCSDSSLTCYEKSQWWAACRASCTAGIYAEDPIQFQTPWSCTTLDTAAASTSHEPSTTPSRTPTATTEKPAESTTSVAATQNAPQCSPTGADCWATRCCSDGSLTCYEKDQWWASCRASCAAGIYAEDPIQFQTPWSCTNLETAVGSTTPAPSTTLAASTRAPTDLPTAQAASTEAPTGAPVTQAATTEPLTDPPATQASTPEPITDVPSTQAATTKASTTTPATSCSVDGADRWGPNLGGCCSGLEACREPRPVDASRFCAPSDPQHGRSCWSKITICRSQCAQTTTALLDCSGTYEDCQKTQCCNDASLTCYSKNEWWAQCKISCVPGIDPTDPILYRTPWSCVALPVAATTTLAPLCSATGVDRWGPDLGGCCTGLQECVEARSVIDPYYCVSGDSNHGSSCWSIVAICRNDCATGGSRLLRQTLRR